MGGDGQRRGQINLRHALTSLRKALDPYLDISRESVALHPAPAYWLDVAEFVRGIKTAAHCRRTTASPESPPP